MRSQKQDGVSVVIVPHLESANADTDDKDSNLSDVEAVEMSIIYLALTISEGSVP